MKFGPEIEKQFLTVGDVLGQPLVEGEDMSFRQAANAQMRKKLIRYKTNPRISFDEKTNKFSIAGITSNNYFTDLEVEEKAGVPLERLRCKVRCWCPDFKFRFAPYLHKIRALRGKPFDYSMVKGTGKPQAWNSLGVCKHLRETIIRARPLIISTRTQMEKDRKFAEQKEIEEQEKRANEETNLVENEQVEN